MKYKIIRIIAVLIMLNIVLVPFLCNELWSIEDISDNAYSFFDMIESIVGGIRSGSADYLDDTVPNLYYFGGLLCTILIFIDALRESASDCRRVALVGSGLFLYVFYQINFGTTSWYVHGNNALLTFGFYISCVGFISILIASLVEEKE